MRAFRLKEGVGSHLDVRTKKNYESGDIVWSESDLRNSFVNKFELVENAPPPTPVKARTTAPSSSTIENEDEGFIQTAENEDDLDDSELEDDESPTPVRKTKKSKNRLARKKKRTAASLDDDE